MQHEHPDFVIKNKDHLKERWQHIPVILTSFGELASKGFQEIMC